MLPALTQQPDPDAVGPNAETPRHVVHQASTRHRSDRYELTLGADSALRVLELLDHPREPSASLLRMLRR